MKEIRKVDTSLIRAKVTEWRRTEKKMRRWRKVREGGSRQGVQERGVKGSRNEQKQKENKVGKKVKTAKRKKIVKVEWIRGTAVEKKE